MADNNINIKANVSLEELKALGKSINDLKKDKSDLVAEFRKATIATKEYDDIAKKLVATKNALTLAEKAGRSEVEKTTRAYFDQGNELRTRMLQPMTAFSGILQDSPQFMYGFSEGMRGIGNNVEFFAQSMNQALLRGTTFKHALQGIASNLFGPGGFILAVSAVTVALQVLPKLFHDTNEAASEAAKEGLNDFKEYLDKLSQYQAGGQYKVIEAAIKATEARRLSVANARVALQTATVLEKDSLADVKTYLAEEKLLEAKLVRLRAYLTENEKQIEKLKAQELLKQDIAGFGMGESVPIPEGGVKGEKGVERRAKAESKAQEELMDLTRDQISLAYDKGEIDFKSYMEQLGYLQSISKTEKEKFEYEKLIFQETKKYNDELLDQEKKIAEEKKRLAKEEADYEKMVRTLMNRLDKEDAETEVQRVRTKYRLIREEIERNVLGIPRDMLLRKAQREESADLLVAQGKDAKNEKRAHEEKIKAWREEHVVADTAMKSMEAGMQSLVSTELMVTRQAKDGWDAAWIAMENTAIQALANVAIKYAVNAAETLLIGEANTTAMTATSVAAGKAVEAAWEGAAFNVTMASFGANVPTGLAALESARIAYSAMSYEKGGWITEPVVGRGMDTGRPYTFGERGSEYVHPNSTVSGLLGDRHANLGQSANQKLGVVNFNLGGKTLERSVLYANGRIDNLRMAY